MDSHKKYLLQHYNILASKLLKGSLDKNKFALKLAKIHAELEKRADHDGLVKDFLNNQGFSVELEREIALIKRMGHQEATFLALDIDKLKRFNDTMGHVAGDKLIKTYASIIGAQTRAADLKGRLGGDEFALFLAGASVEDAKIIAERIRVSIIKEIKKIFPKFPWEQTISIGITQMNDKDRVESLRERADKALYKAKKQRNQVVIK